jgi:hypothetical protein
MGAIGSFNVVMGGRHTWKDDGEPSGDVSARSMINQPLSTTKAACVLGSYKCERGHLTFLKGHTLGHCSRATLHKWPKRARLIITLLAHDRHG